MEVFGHVKVLGLTDHDLNLSMTLTEEDGFHVCCPRYPEFEEVTLSRTRSEAIVQFIDYFFATCDLIRRTRQKGLPI
jgi:hypothetical protein